MKMRIIVAKIVYLPIIILATPIFGIVGFFGYIISLWEGWWKWK